MDFNPKSLTDANPVENGLSMYSLALLLALAAVTIEPISQRPVTSLPANLERLLAWACAGTVFATAYADRLLLMLLVLVGAAGFLELAQIEVLQRHGRLSDFLVKAAGGLVGTGSVRALQYLRSGI